MGIEHPRYFDGFDREGAGAATDVLECHRVAGEDSYLLKVKTRNTRTLDELLVEHAAHHPRRHRAPHTTIVLASIKEEPRIHVSRTAADGDPDRSAR